MIAAEEIKNRIEEALPGAQVEVNDFTGGGDHYEATVIAEQFDGKPMIARHRMV